MVRLFGGEKGRSLADMRHDALVRKAVGSHTFITPEKLPPTESATKYHSMRVYYQVMVWMQAAEDMRAQDWGWCLQRNRFSPVIMDKDAAPEQLLRIIHCSCRTGCVSMKCTCQRNAMPCTNACGSCQTDGSCVDGQVSVDTDE